MLQHILTSIAVNIFEEFIPNNDEKKFTFASFDWLNCCM
jgi:hypothetical protein